MFDRFCSAKIQKHFETTKYHRCCDTSTLNKERGLAIEIPS